MSRPQVSLSIAAVERDTGLSKDTLRVWERRYGFPAPARDNFGERAYSVDQVEKLRTIRRLIDAGHRPGKIIGLPMEQLRTISCRPEQLMPTVAVSPLLAHVALLKSHRIVELRQALNIAVAEQGLAAMVTEVIAPLTVLVGDEWARGELEVFEEHLFTEAVKGVLRASISQLESTATEPKILLTTVPNEVHSLGLLMAEALFSLNGARCISLGVQTPIWDIVMAAKKQDVDVVALSFSACVGPNQVVDGLNELRAALPASVEIWAGGSSPVLQRRPPEGVQVLSNLELIGQQIQRWRDATAQRRTYAAKVFGQ